MAHVVGFLPPISLSLKSPQCEYVSTDIQSDIIIQAVSANILSRNEGTISGVHLVHTRYLHLQSLSERVPVPASNPALTEPRLNSRDMALEWGEHSLTSKNLTNRALAMKSP